MLVPHQLLGGTGTALLLSSRWDAAAPTQQGAPVVRGLPSQQEPVTLEG